MFCCFYKAFFGQRFLVETTNNLQFKEGCGLFRNNGEVDCGCGSFISQYLYMYLVNYLMIKIIQLIKINLTENTSQYFNFTVNITKIGGPNVIKQIITTKNGATSTTVALNRIAIKILPFWPADPEILFYKIENNPEMYSYRVATTALKFKNVLFGHLLNQTADFGPEAGISCKISKITCHTNAPSGNFQHSSSRFKHINIDIIDT